MPKRRGYAHKHAVMTLIERGSKGGKSRWFHVEGTKASDLLPILKAHIDPQSHVMTDEAGQYAHLGKYFTEHDFVTHSSGEYVRGDAKCIIAQNIGTRKFGTNDGKTSCFASAAVSFYTASSNSRRLKSRFRASPFCPARSPRLGRPRR